MDKKLSALLQPMILMILQLHPQVKQKILDGNEPFFKNEKTNANPIYVPFSFFFSLHALFGEVHMFSSHSLLIQKIALMMF
jgi:endo-1,4-beta-D-glucanase Y